MGEFTTRVRYTEEGFADVNNVRRKLFRNAEYIYSWRSRRTKYDLADSETGNTIGIRQPSSSGNLLDRLSDRKRYTEDIMRTMGGSRDNSLPPERLPVRSVTDVGHPFTSVKYVSINEGRFVNTQASSGTVVTTAPIFALSHAYRTAETTSTPGFVTDVLPGQLSAPGILERNARLNPVFFEMLPTKQIAQIGETVVSLLRGEFPSILRNLSTLIRRWEGYGKLLKDTPKYVGGEYLNSVFGWSPLIRDFENAIKVLIAVDHLIYGTAYRRHRTVKWDTKFWVEQNPTFYLTPQYGDGRVSQGSWASLGAERRWTMSYDIRLSARLVPIARPGIGANAFIDQASEKLQYLGIWYPALGWDLLPYSWLVDWATSLGSSINNASLYGSEPGQVNIDYAWATSCVRVLADMSFANEKQFNSSGSLLSARGHPKAMSIAKTRFPATPFGFGLDLSALSGSQIAILVALGLAKRR